MTPVQDLIGDPPSQCIIEVSELLDHDKKMGGDWRQLWQKLLDSSPDEAVICQQREGPTTFLLKAWCQTNPPHVATVGELVNMLNAVNRSDITMIIGKYCQVRMDVFSRMIVSGKLELWRTAGLLHYSMPSCMDISCFIFKHLKVVFGFLKKLTLSVWNLQYVPKMHVFSIHFRRHFHS